jgi:hypothetical protein
LQAAHRLRTHGDNGFSESDLSSLIELFTPPAISS